MRRIRNGNSRWSQLLHLVRGEEKPRQLDSPLIKRRITRASHAKTYEEARREWRYTNVILEDDEDFVERCELCNQPGLRANFVIVNIKTSNNFKVGSTCIKRFIILEGAETQEESNEMFEAQALKMMAGRHLAEKYLPQLLDPVPSPQAVTDFREASKVFLGSLEQLRLDSATWENYLTALFGDKRPQEIINRVRIALFYPAKLYPRRRSV